MLIENGQKQIFYSQFGALAVPAVLLSGPEDTLKYILKLDPTEQLMNNVWAEGGILYNADERRVLFWGGDSIAVRPYLRRPLLKLLPALWQGWSINWAMHGVADLAYALGWDIWEVLKDVSDDTDFLAGNGPVVERVISKQDADMIISVRSRNGEVRDYRVLSDENFDGSLYYLALPYRVLSLGPELLSLLETYSTASLPKEGSEQEPDSGALIDEETHTLWIWESEIDPRYLEALGRRWPGWQIKGHVEGLIRHVILSGRDATHLVLSEEQINQQLLHTLVDFQGFDPDRLAHAIRQTLPEEEQQSIKFAPGFFSVNASPLTSQERRTILLDLLANLSSNPNT